MRLLSPDDACIRVTTRDGRRYDGRTIDVDSRHADELRAVGYTVADTAGPAPRSGGFECTVCSFKAWFRTCSRCGGVCERPEAA